jgi:hypothetical protein
MRILADCWYQTAHIALPIPVVAAGGALLQTPRPLPVRYAKHRQCVPVVQGGVSISRVPIFVLLYPWHHHAQRQTPPRWKVHTVQIACAPPPERSHATRLPPPPTAFGTYVRRPHHTQPLHSAGALDPAAYGERVLEATMHNALSVLRSRCERECERKVHRDVMGGAEAFGSDVVLEDCDRGLVHTRQPTLWYPEHTAHQSTLLRISSGAELCETHRRTEAQRRRGEAVRAALCPRLRRSHARGAGRPRTHSQFEQPIQMCHLRSCRLLRPELRLPVGPLRHDLQRARHGGVRLGRTG